MIFILLLCEKRRYLPGQSKFTGDWELHGGSELLDESILILNTSQYFHGGIIKTNPLPSKDWTANCSVTFGMNSNANFNSTMSKMAIWLTREIENFNFNFSGKLDYYGIALLFHYNSSYIQIEVRENDGYNRNTFFNPTFSSSLVSPQIHLFFNYTNKNLNISILHDKQLAELYNTRPRVSIQKNIFSLTSGSNSSNIFFAFFNSGMFSYDKCWINISNLPFPGNEAIDKVRRGGIFNSDVIISVIDSMYEFSDLLDTSTVLQTVIRNQVTPFIEDWARRDIRILENTKKLSKQINETLQGIEQGIDLIQYTIDKSIFKIKELRHNLESDLYFGVLKGYDLPHEIRKEKKLVKQTNKQIFKLVWICLVEIGAFVGVIIYNSFRQNK